MNDKQEQISKLLWDFQSLREEQVIKVCNCTEKDINQLISRGVLSKDKKTKILKYSKKEINNRNIVAFDVVMDYLDRKPIIKLGKHPVNVTMITQEASYDIIAIKEKEVDTLFEIIDEVSKADKIIIIIETKQYIEKSINTKRPCYICTYAPLEIVDKVN